jgi:protein-tyrosine phosphatase
VIDLHSHVLPGIDDGPAELVESLAMARVAVLAGTTVLAATPHVRHDHPRVVPAEIPERVAQLNAALHERRLGLRVVGGGEVAMEDALGRDVAELRAVTLNGNGRDLLVETPHRALPDGFEDDLHRIAERGFRVLLGHPEMSRELQREPERLGAIAASGIHLQVTAAALAGSARSRTTRLALRAVREGWATVIASDGHRAGWRPPSLAEGLAAAGRELPQHTRLLRWMVGAAPAAILAGVALPPRPPVPSGRPRRGR